MQQCDANDMVVFARVAELGGLSSAARTLGMPKATVSRAIARLESALGARLLDRSARKVALTTAGQVFSEHCQRVAEEVEAAQSRVMELESSVRGLLRVAAPITFGRYLLGPVMPRFLAQYPQVQMELHLTDRAFDPIEHGLDLVVRPGRLADSSLVSRELGRAVYGIYATPRYLASHAPLCEPKDLARHALLDSFDDQETGIWSFERDGLRVDVPVVPRVRLNDALMRRDVALADLGIAHVPSATCVAAVRAGALQEVLPGWQSSRSVPVHALWASRRHVPLRMRAFMDHLIEEIPLAPPAGVQDGLLRRA